MKPLYSSEGTNSLPTWLQRSTSTPYCASALKLLSERENIRAAAREESRPREETHHGSRRRRNFGPEVIDHYSVETGAHPDQIHKNRYYMVEPYDRSRVVVGCADGEASGAGGQSCGRYLNASWVKERYGRKWWIANQAPLPSTAHAFLSVILQPSTFPPTSLENKTNDMGRIRTVVQLTKNTEGGRTKAHPYFPDQVGQSLVLRPEDGHDAPALKSTLVEVKTHDDALCIESTIAVYQYGEDTGKPILFRHLLYHAWPDHGVPSRRDQPALLNFARLVDTLNKTPLSADIISSNDTPSDPPIMVGCSAGIGRTGTFIAISSILRAFGLINPTTLNNSHQELVMPFKSPLGPIPQEFADDMVVEEVDSLREQRPGMVQQDQQILFVYEILTSAFKRH
ncbi:hypothetical protein PLEOSDRAFT_1037062 [Pleurotus ostreatus PC15]|uniref:Phosphatases II n=1 Tax=Pleurotus ostreatus (strain PC15) TaxID=1137138 RepID=A0A067NWM0_PLEO1|nr:hypothetical protein PLEOSDRAFT_1037062 [Pleurotus ostreatus PC15]